MFLDTAFLKNDEIQLVLEKTVDGNEEKSGFLPIIFLSAASMALKWEHVI